MMVILEKKLQEELSDFGKEVAIDGKILQNYANKVSTKEPDGRRETQADMTAKNYYSNNGTKTTKYYFGFRVHLLADVNDKLPLAFKVTPANAQAQASVAKQELPNTGMAEINVFTSVASAILGGLGLAAPDLTKKKDEE